MSYLLSMFVLLLSFLVASAQAALSHPSVFKGKAAISTPASVRFDDHDGDDHDHDDEHGHEDHEHEDDAHGGHDDEDAEQDEDAEFDVHEVERRDISVEVALDGVFVSERMEQVALRPEVWTDFKVVEAVPHGARVRKGDVLVKFDDRKFDQSLEDKSLQLQIDEIALQQAVDAFPRTKKSIELKYTQAKRAFDFLQAEYKRFQEVTRKMSEKMALQNLASSQFALESAREELEQLQQMYDADELTEETEEIVLKRQRFAVARSELYLESARINFDHTMNVTLPRREETYELDLESAQLTLERAEMDQSLGLNKQQYELEKLRENRKRSLEQHAKLVADRSMMELCSPMDGIVYYGRCVDGKFGGIATLKSKLVPFGSIQANTVVMTVVDGQRLNVLAMVGENDFSSVEADQDAEVKLVADDGVELEASVKEIGGVPQAGNKFAVTLEIDLDDVPNWLVPGMTCKASITTYEADDAVVLPKALLQTDEEDADEKYVMVLEEDGELERRDLELGEEQGDDVEILDGLDEGDRVAKGVKDDDHDHDHDEDHGHDHSHGDDDHDHDHDHDDHDHDDDVGDDE